MLIKVLIIIFLLALLASLGRGFYFLMIDQGDIRKRHLFHSLGVRLGFAAALMALVVYGLSTGQLRSQAPWEVERALPTATDTSAVPPNEPQ